MRVDWRREAELDPHLDWLVSHDLEYLMEVNELSEEYVIAILYLEGYILEPERQGDEETKEIEQE